MENNDLLEMVRSKAQGWLTKSYDAETRAQVQALLDNEDPTELIECFSVSYTHLTLPTKA